MHTLKACAFSERNLPLVLFSWLPRYAPSLCAIDDILSIEPGIQPRHSWVVAIRPTNTTPV